MVILPKSVNPIVGGMKMDAGSYWQLFMETGAPEMYLLYNKARKVEDIHVLDDPGACPEGNSIQ